MRIEKNWDDCFVYAISLEIPASSYRKKWFTNRTIVLKKELDFSEMKAFIKQTFGPEVTLLNVDLWDEGLLIKER
ncbi:hypothetical protein AB6887_12505 [Carnobacterium divergens]|uniref:Uncharacterized protein n=1 Tax=Carnobacterium divergens TaxID=2748 RepID=A0A2R8A4E2_CARDV|nr:hypothetical protein [Carnobacterium divergens]MCO6018955.1 hypothetical protein [Carnobacterium divergens]MPQ23344.1 hypothetical protein [Carnobacterium divergens]TFI63734.1 hypothetical protein CKN62_03040 [Carnobacterium divergens]TFI74206.1 hypothetical protein CKN58_03005 [Carnobacterium divergens]TFI74546.1 hypothetical protein CKN81_03055 [Carnobacterium divergens]